MAEALQALGKGDYATACGIYDQLKEQNPSDFTAWYGLGQCQSLDNRVVRDSSNPTKWRYVASYQSSIQAYQRAFEVLSLSHKSFQRGAYEPLRELLFMNPSKLRPARPLAPDTTTLFGRLDRDGDTLVFRPIPLSVISSGDPAGVPKGLRSAIELQQQTFHRIAGAWSSALPRSSGAKEAVAVSLEMRGDRSALDTLRLAERLAATDSLQRLRLAAAEAILRLKFVEPDDANELAGIQRLADSLLAQKPHPSPIEASYLAPLAAMTGKCALVGTLEARASGASRRTELEQIPTDIIADAVTLKVKTALGCARGSTPSVEQVRRRIAGLRGKRSGVAESELVGRTVRLTEPPDSALVASVAGSSADYLLRAQLQRLRGNGDSAKKILARVDASRSVTGYDAISADAVYPEARLLLAVGDTTRAAAALDRMLDRLRFSPPGALNLTVSMATLVRAMALRAEIAAARKESGAPVQWGRAVASLWSNADPELKPTVRRLLSLSAQR
jgi:tetratricopeptide (TPR) repeat protein